MNEWEEGKVVSFRRTQGKARQCVPVVEDVVRRRLLWIGDVVRGGANG